MGVGLLAVALILAAHGSSRRLERMAAAAGAEEDVPLYLPTGRTLRFATLGFSAVAADLIYLWSIQYYGNYPGGPRHRHLWRLYAETITALDPGFRDAYLLGSLILSMEARRPEEAVRLLDRGIQAVPDDWVLPFEAGFVAYQMLGDYPQAASYFEVAMERPGAHPVVRRFHAEMLRRSGDLEGALRHWAEVLATADDDYVRQVAARHVRDLRREVDLGALRGAVEDYRRREGRNPPDLRSLVHQGLLYSVPVDPDGRPYRYDPATGTVEDPAGGNRRRGSDGR